MAIAASTWFHGSVCPPGYQGIAPESSCASAIEPAVWTTSRAEITPGTAGTSGRGTRRSRLAQVDHEALADQRVEQPLGGAGDPGPLHQVPHQEPVVQPGQRVVVVVRSDRALQP